MQSSDNSWCLQVTAHKLFLDVPIETAVDVPRLHHQLFPNVLYYEHCFDKVQQLGTCLSCNLLSMYTIL